MKRIGTMILATILTVAPTFAQTLKESPVVAFAGHGGGNGGDDFELELKKRSLQIGYFLKSTVGSKTFNSLNADAVLEAINRTDIDVVAGNVVDKYGTIRTCVNEENRGLITCNLDRLNELKKKGQLDIMTAMLFHEILGIMGLELGYQENVSLYPVSSKIIPYWSVIEATPVSEANIRPEYYGVDSSSYGITLVNKETKESLRMICLNDNIEIHRCRNYSVVRSAAGRQAPLVSKIVSLSPSDLAAINFENVSGNTYYMKNKQKDALDYTKEILNIKNNLSLIGKTKTVKNNIFEYVLDFTTKAVMEKEYIPARIAQAEANRVAQVQAAENAKIAKEKADKEAAEKKEKEEAEINRIRAERMSNFEKLFKGTTSEKKCQKHFLDTNRVLNSEVIAVCAGLSEQALTCIDSLIANVKVLDIAPIQSYYHENNHVDEINSCKKIKDGEIL